MACTPDQGFGDCVWGRGGRPSLLTPAGRWRKVLRAAAMTYVAALAQALAQLLRLLMIANRGNRGHYRRH